MRPDRRGFSLVELLIAMAVMAVIGVGLTRMLINDSEFVANVEAMTNARQSARAAMNMLSAELRMVSDGGLIFASAGVVVLRIPYAFGMLCAQQGSARYGFRLPGDSATYASGGMGGLGWLGDAGTYEFTAVTYVQRGAADKTPQCTNHGIDYTVGAEFLDLGVVVDTMPVGTIFYLYDVVQYSFGPSADLPGRVGLWRSTAGASEELLAPFDAASGFAFYVATSDTAITTWQIDLQTVTGLELLLIAASEITPKGAAVPPTFEIQTRINFLNKKLQPNWVVY